MSELQHTANDLVYKLADGTAVTDSLVIASRSGNEHRAVLQMVRANLADLNEVGRVAFEMRPFETAGGRQVREIAILDEPASALLMTYLRNTPKVKEFKKNLVAGFYAMRQMLTAPATPAELILAQAKMLVEQERRIDAVEQGQIELAARVDAIMPTQRDEVYYSGRGWARLRGVEATLKYMQRLGAKAGVLGRAAGLEHDDVPDPRWGIVNGWPLWVWDAAHDQIANPAPVNA